MPKQLPETDFRARRIVLSRKDFAYAPKPVERPTDPIDKRTWKSIVILPDDVAIRTSNYHGTTLRQLNDLCSCWIESLGNRRNMLFPSMLDAHDDFQSATYSALTGFYRLSITALRSALELVTIGTWAQTCGKRQEFRKWRKGTLTLSFRDGCDGLISATDKLRKHLRETVNDSLFDQKNSVSEGGFARRIFSGVSDFSHSRPGYADADMRNSNGPIYVRKAFNHVSWLYFESLGLCFVLVLLARPKLKLPPPVLDLFSDTNRIRSRVTRAAFEFLYDPRN